MDVCKHKVVTVGESGGFPEHLQGLLHPRAYPHPVQRVELVETHISWVLLTGEFAYKIKRPVHYAFIDLRSAEHRAFLCHEELRLNRRFAPEIYLDVCVITALDGEARLGGSGPAIEHAVKMRQFPRPNELDRLLAAMQVEPGELETFGLDLAIIHAGLPDAKAAQAWGRPAAAKALILENLAECARAAHTFGNSSAVHALREPLQVRLDAAMQLMAERFAGGKVRECHGDLHCRNIVRHGWRLLAFDCMEFEPAFRWIDVADEIAFLLADLDSHERPLHAAAFLGGYLAQSGDYQACRLLDLYKAHRSLVRAKVIALSAADAAAANMAGASTTGATPGRRQYDRHLDCARRALATKHPKLILMSGLSGSGKTWIATRLAPLLEAVHLRSDVERKRLAGIRALARSDSGLEQGLYSPQASARVYRHLAECAGNVLAGGYTAIVDATFQRHADRVHFRKLAAQFDVPAWVVHCHAPREALERRVAERSRRNDEASEADLSVLRWQEKRFEPIQPAEALTVIEARTTDVGVLDRLIRQFRDAGL